jgi:hypothetical protein
VAVIFCSLVRAKDEEKRDGRELKDHGDDLPAVLHLCNVDLDVEAGEDSEGPGRVGGSRVSNVANACRLYDVSVNSAMSTLDGSHPGIDRSNKTVHCQHVSLESPPAQWSVMGGVTLSEAKAFPTRVFSIRQSRAPSYPIIGERHSALPSNTIESDVSRSEGGRIMFPLRREVCGVTVIRRFPESEYEVLCARNGRSGVERRATICQCVLGVAEDAGGHTMFVQCRTCRQSEKSGRCPVGQAYVLWWHWGR